MRLRYRDHRRDPAAWARRLGVSLEAVQLYLDCEVLDLHTCSFMWSRSFRGYDLRRRHRPWLPCSAWFNQVDLPRVREAAMAGIAWDIPTNPWRPGPLRARMAVRHVRAVARTLAEFPGEFRVVRGYSEYRAALDAGCTASFIALQGGQALDHSLACLERIPDDLVHRITLVHMTESRIGAPSTQRHKAQRGLTAFGREFVRRMQEKRILVDLAHINRKGFFEALEHCEPGQPPLVTHTGVEGVRPLWRNLDDAQLRAIADRGGTVGIIYNNPFLHPGLRCPLERVIDHMEHACRVAGEDCVSLGSDYDGLILLPQGLEDITCQPRMVELMLRRGWGEPRVRKVLGGNFLRVLEAVRP